MDALIAATAKNADRILVTLNAKHFPMVNTAEMPVPYRKNKVVTKSQAQLGVPRLRKLLGRPVDRNELAIIRKVQRISVQNFFLNRSIRNSMNPLENIASGQFLCPDARDTRLQRHQIRGKTFQLREQ